MQVARCEVMQTLNGGNAGDAGNGGGVSLATQAVSEGCGMPGLQTRLVMKGFEVMQTTQATRVKPSLLAVF